MLRICTALLVALSLAASPDNDSTTDQVPGAKKPGAAQTAGGQQGPNAKPGAPNGAGGAQNGAPGNPRGPNGPGGPGGPGNRGGPGQRPGAGRYQRGGKAPIRKPNSESMLPVLTSVYGNADPVALGLSDDGARVYSVEGASIAVLDATKPKYPEVERIPIDASVMSLFSVGKRLFIAGGTNGVGVMDMSNAKHQLRWFDSIGGRPCTQVAVSGSLVLATFATARNSELRLYLKGTLKQVGKAKLPGDALDFAVSGEYAYFALGAGGVARADLKHMKSPDIERGPDLSVLPTTDSYKLPRGYVRDVAVAGTHLYLAADIAGLIDIDLTTPWGADSSVHHRPLGFLGRPAYALRVDARGDRVALATGRAPSVVGDGAPLGTLGRFGWNLTAGDVATDKWPAGASDALWLFHQRPENGKLEMEAVEPVPDSSWRTLVMRGKKIYEQHARLGMIVRVIADKPKVAQAGDAKLPIADELSLAGRRQPAGLPCIDGKPSLRDPRLLLFGVDPAGADGRGILRITNDDKLKLAEGLGSHLPIGSSVGAQWPDVLASREWFISSFARSWRVNRLTHRPKYDISSWDLVPPQPPDRKIGGTTGSGPFLSQASGDLLLCTRSGTRFGLVGFSNKQIAGMAGEVRPGKKLEIKPIWQAETHFDQEAPAARTFNLAVFALEDGRKIAAVAAGANTDPKSEHFEHPQIVFFDVTHAIATPPRKLGIVWGKDAKGLAIGVDACRIKRRTYVVAATTAGQMLMFDCNDPSKARQVRQYELPINPYDGQRDNFLDVEIATDLQAGRTFAYLAAGRAGLIRVELTQAAGKLKPDAIISTPGYASGLCSTVVDGERYWLVGDQKMGLRLYR